MNGLKLSSITLEGQQHNNKLSEYFVGLECLSKHNHESYSTVCLYQQNRAGHFLAASQARALSGGHTRTTSMC